MAPTPLSPISAPLIALAEKPRTLCDKLADFLTAHPNVWIDGMVLASIAGQYAWRSRVSDLRTRGYVIDNRQRVVPNETNHFLTYTVSEYRYVPEAK